MNITIEKNKLFPNQQSLVFDKNIITLVGENGSGKSTILESIFENSLEQPQSEYVICFSSGQNESYSSIYVPFIHKSRKIVSKKADSTYLGLNDIKTFYFDSNWSKFLVFFASILKSDGLTRGFLKDKYVEVDGANEDISSRLTFTVEVKMPYLNVITDSLKEEELDPLAPTLRRSDFNVILTKLIEEFVNDKYDFDIPLKKTVINTDSIKAKNAFGKNPFSIFQFLSIATNENYFIDLNEVDLILKDNINFGAISDGEYQLLVVYSLIDLFDSPKTLFLLDEIDSHLYYKNIKSLWDYLNTKVTGKVLTTTHIAESIISNDFNSLRVISKGEILSKSILDELAVRLNELSSSSEYYYKLAAKYEYIALVEDESDWRIFYNLAKLLLGGGFERDKMDKICVIKCPSGYSCSSQVFGDTRIKWVENFKSINKDDFSTKQIFMICDRDELPLNDLSKNDLVSVVGKYKRKIQLKKDVKENAYLLSWRRKQIENYLLSYSMLTKRNKIHEIHQDIGQVYHLQENNKMDIKQIQDLEIKTKIQSLYVHNGVSKNTNNPEGVDFSLLAEVINDIPASEISDDIVNMYNFIVLKIN